MNILLSVLFLFLVFFLYYEVGDYVLSLIKIEPDFKSRILTGFISISCILFVVSSICNIAHLSWFILCMMNMIAVALMLLFMARFHFKEMIAILKINWFDVLKEHFLMIPLAAGCIYLCRYGDVSSLVNEMSVLIDRTDLAISITDLYAQSYMSMVSFYASVFHISYDFFVHYALNMHNMMLILLAFQAMLSLFTEQKYSQYIVFASFLFYFYIHVDSFKMAFNQGLVTSIEGIKGDSFVKITAIPLIMVYGKELLEKANLGKIILTAALLVSLLGYSENAFLYVVAFALGLFMMKCALLANDDHKIAAIPVIVIVAAVYYAGLVKLSAYNSGDMLNQLAIYDQYLIDVDDLIFLHIPIILGVSCVLSENKSVKALLGILLLIEAILYTRYLDSFLIYYTRHVENLMMLYSGIKILIIPFGMTATFLLILKLIGKGEKA